jgi:hypothetical protein
MVYRRTYLDSALRNARCNDKSSAEFPPINRLRSVRLRWMDDPFAPLRRKDEGLAEGARRPRDHDIGAGGLRRKERLCGR